MTLGSRTAHRRMSTLPPTAMPLVSTNGIITVEEPMPHPLRSNPVRPTLGTTSRQHSFYAATPGV